MVETWLKPNRRALLLGMALPVAIAILGLLLAMKVIPAPLGSVAVLVGWGLFGLGTLLVLALARHMLFPRVGYRNGEVLFYLKAREPVAVPIDVVEGFLLGQGPTLLPGKRNEGQETVTVVVRLAQKEEAWSKVDVKPSLASWCDSYITIRGTWCEPLDVSVVDRLNLELSKAKQKCKTAVT